MEHSERDSRTAMLIGWDGVEKLHNSSVLLFGAGGVGGASLEALARAGVGTITVVDFDTVSVSNLNRQLIARQNTIGRKKCSVSVEHVQEIDPGIHVIGIDCFLSEETIDRFSFTDYDFVIDAIDTVSAKLLLAKRCTDENVPLISCMGTGNKLDPTKLRISDIYETSGCPLARVMRRDLKKRNVSSLPVLWSPEEARKPLFEDEISGRHSPGSVSFVPPAAGFMIAGYVIRKLTGVE